MKLAVEDQVPVRCATWFRDVEADPIGSAPSCDGVLVVDWPLPWPADLSDVAALAPLRDMLGGSGTRLQATVPALPGRSIITLYRRTDPQWFSGYAAFERTVDAELAVSAAIELLESADGSEPTAQDLLICSHGRRDRCCGSLGTALYTEAVAAFRDRPEVRIRRTSHLGGHRFAPTALSLPSGTSWAFLDGPALAAVVDGTADLQPLLARYRGCTGLPSAAAQALERVALADVGRTLTTMERTATQLSDGRVQLDVRCNGDLLTWRARARSGRTLAVPACGEPIATARKTSDEIVLSELERPALRFTSAER